MDPDRAEIGYHPALILSALTAGARYGLEVMERTGLSSGTVYPAMRRLEAAGFVAGRWEDESHAHGEGRAARRYYEVTPEGREALAQARERIHARQRALGWATGAESGGG